MIKIGSVLYISVKTNERHTVRDSQWFLSSTKEGSYSNVSRKGDRVKRLSSVKKV